MSVSASILKYFRERDRGWVLSLLLAVCLLYLPFLGSPFIFDDLSFFMTGISGTYTHWFRFDLRWLPNASIAWTEVFFTHEATHFYHLVNLLIHAGNTLLLFYLLRRLMLAGRPANSSQGALIWGAWAGALVFALHPVAVYAVGYVVQRSILMAVFFALAMQVAYLRGLMTGQARWLALAAIAFFLAVFSKEHSVTTLAVLMAETLLLRGQIRAGRRALWLTWAAFILIGLLIVLRAQGVFGTPYEAMAAELFKEQGIAADKPMLHLLSILTQAALFFKYLLLWLLPNPAWMSIDMREPFMPGLSAWQGWLGAAAFLLYGGIGLRLLLRGGRIGLLGLAMLYPWLQFFLEFASVRVQEPFVLYRSYLWMPGLMLVFPLLAEKIRAKPALAGMVVLAVALAAGSVNRLWVMADPYRLWNDAALLLGDKKAAGADRIYFNRGQAEVGMRRMDDAIADFRRSIEISPQYAVVHFELGWALARLNRLDEAMAEFDESIRLDPGFSNAYFGKGLILKMRHEDKKAAEMMSKSCELKNAMACLIVKGYVERSGN